MAAKFIKPMVVTEGLARTPMPTPADILISGNGDTEAYIPFSSTDGTVISGIWSSEAFSKKKFHPNDMEFCYLIEGDVKISDTEGNASEFSAGDAFVVEPGFDGVWESKTAVKKYFVIAKCQ
ncbi:cupin domain-containing protein [Amphritea opalescens]|nr:cupin domain-containing protein [Amphritea opalescens]